MSKRTIFILFIIIVILMLIVICGLPYATIRAQEVEAQRGEKTDEQIAREYWTKNPLTEAQLIEFDIVMQSGRYRKAMEELEIKIDENPQNENPQNENPQNENPQNENLSIQEIQLSKNFRLIREAEITEGISVRGSKTKQKHVTWKAVGIADIELYRYTIYGSFWYNGKESKVSNSEATGSTSYPGWTKTSSSSKAIGAVSTGIWTFTYYVGIAPVGMTLRSVDHAANLYCDKNGKIFSRTW